MRLLVLLCAVLLGVRFYAAGQLGFGDSEALYASYALHPQAAYLDHPGLVGLVARLIGSGTVPAPQQAHVVTAVVASAIPFLVVLVARLAGASARASVMAGGVVAVVPELAIGLFGLTPDLLLAPLWLGAIALALFGLVGPEAPAAPPPDPRKKLPPGARKKKAAPPPVAKEDWRRPAALAFAGLLAGIGASAKVSGLLLVVALAYAYRVARVRTPLAWAGLAAGVLSFVPVVVFEARAGFPMLHHRFVEAPSTVHASLPLLALRNVGTLLGGQLAYLSPVLAVLAVIVARDLVRRRNDDAASRVLFAVFAVPVLPLFLLCLLSPVAEPHWLAPPLLVLPVHAARHAELVGKRVLWAGTGLAAALTALVHLWILVPEVDRVVARYVDPKTDITNELYGWPMAVRSIRQTMQANATPHDPSGRETIVVAPHWIVCAQLQAALPDVRVGCATEIPDDFDRWLPRTTWKNADQVLWVTDNRFANDGAKELPGHVVASQSTTRIYRAGREAREFRFLLYSRRAVSSVTPLRPRSST